MIPLTEKAGSLYDSKGRSLFLKHLRKPSRTQTYPRGGREPTGCCSLGMTLLWITKHRAPPPQPPPHVRQCCPLETGYPVRRLSILASGALKIRDPCQSA